MTDIDLDKVVAEIELIASIARAAEQDFADLEAAWPASRRGSRAQRAYDQMKGRWNGVRDCSRDALLIARAAQMDGEG